MYRSCKAVASQVTGLKTALKSHCHRTGSITMNSLLYTGLFYLTWTAYSVSSVAVSAGDMDSSNDVFPWNNLRLPNYVIPLHYDLLIHPNLTTLTFGGLAMITVVVTQPTKSIILHSKHLNITKTGIQSKVGSSLVQQDVLLLEHPASEQIALQHANALNPGKNYTLYIEYNGYLSESFHGFYKGTYKTPDGEVRVLASTQFEPTAARMAFPCFDEPAFKATFSIKIRREARHSAVSNMPIVKTVKLDGGILEDHFDVSVKMSTYLVAFIVSDFKFISQVTNRGVKISVYTVPHKIEQATYALGAAVKLLDFYEEYFRIPYPLPKQGTVFLPGVGIFSKWFGNLVTMDWWNDLWLNEGFAKFMEYIAVNITYPELQVEDKFLDKCFSAMEVDSLNSSHAVSTPVENTEQIHEMFDEVSYDKEDKFLDKCFSAMEVDSLNSSHAVSTPVENTEQIHEMFDEVSYDKGACILNMLQDYIGTEGFEAGIINYLQRFSYRNAQNQDLWDSITDEDKFLDKCFSAMEVDSLNSSHAVSTPVENTEQIHEMFDEVSYDKGACILNMLQDYIGTEGFEAGIINYLQRFSYRNAQNQDLWDSITDHWTEDSIIDVKAMMNTWTLQKGFPLVTVTVKGKRVYLKQEHYQKGAKDQESAGLLWHIPLTYMTSKTSKVQRFLLKSKTVPEEAGGEGERRSESVVEEAEGANKRTGTSSSGVRQRRPVKPVLPLNKRFTSVMFFCLLSIGLLPIDKALSLTTYLRKEDKIMPVFQGMEELIPIYKLMEKRDMKEIEEQMKAYILNLLRGLIDIQSWTDDGTVSERMLRSSLLLFACFRKYQPCVEKAKDYFTKWRESNVIHLFLARQILVNSFVSTLTLYLLCVVFLCQVTEFFDLLKENGSQLRCVQQAKETIGENISWMDKNFDLVKTWLEKNN
ncbi:hypothetical protein AB205_0045030 [Aquarana catesbeiana]|uniref:Aminopeptidase n=1 Tax=Aquarana catesbeiana TaxID=8400 RepID=A0A2G9SDP6_AQUCT|nr:hypothetical protein AB205_0045030 [Aquarana catesbeiana]